MEFKKGDKVRLHKGAVVTSTHPKNKTRTVTRSYVVTVFDFYAAHSWKNWDDEIQTRKAEIIWPGTGGYWCRVSADDVDKVE